MRSLIVKVLIIALPILAHAQPGCWDNYRTGDDQPRSKPSYLYPVYKWDGTGEKIFGYINNKGKLVIGYDRLPRNTIYVGDFHEGFAKIHIKKDVADAMSQNYLVGYIDTKGQVVIPARYDYARDLHDGRAFVSINSEGTHGFIDRTGKVVIKIDIIPYEPYFGNRGYDFYGGLASIPGKGGGNARCIWIDPETGRSSRSMHSPAIFLKG